MAQQKVRPRKKEAAPKKKNKKIIKYRKPLHINVGMIKMCIRDSSKGYATRPTLSVERIGQLIAFIKERKPDVICMVDNCYGEFVERMEPADVGADMMVGSLIKNPGGGLAPIGGYIAGRKDCIDRASYRLTAPGPVSYTHLPEAFSPGPFLCRGRILPDSATAHPAPA